MMELRAVLARLLSRYEFHVVGDSELQYWPTKPTTSPMDLFMTVQKRTSLPDADTLMATGAPGPNDNHAVENLVLRPLTHTVSADKLPRTFIVYGSNMGTSEDYATQMTEQLKRMGFADITLVSLNDWDFGSMKSADGRRSLVVAITSTYNGMPPDNARNFAKLLDKETRADILKDVDFVLFGCGNSLWHTFLKFPRHLYQRLDELGATPLTEFTAGDSNDELDDEFMKWSLQVGMILTDHYGSSVDAYIDAVTDKSLPYSLKYVDNTPAAPFRLSPENASVKVNRELQDVERSGRSTRHIEITLDDTSDISYMTGDHLNIYPVNAPDVVREVSAILELDLDVVFELEQVSDASRFAHSAAAVIHGRACTVADALQYVCDWKEAPSRELVVALSETSGNKPAYDLLRKAAEDANTLGKQSAGWSAFTAQNRTVLDVLRTYAPLVRQIPFATLLHFVSAMDPRRYSIASCQSVVGNEVHISAAIVNDTVNGRSYGGLATEYLASLEAGARVSVSHLPAQEAFHLPPPSDVPVVFVGAGTGIAPFRGFLQEMKHAGIGGATMYFGCRSPEYDYLYKDELEQYIQDGMLSKLQTAFSRVGDERKYVQHHVSQDSAKIWSHLQNSGRIYVCGSADKLGKSMTTAMVRIFEEHGGLSADEASTYLSNLISDGRYAQDIW
ncbi:riboflavin synthase domain-like protein [Linderina pennispora]|uniref:NADPH--hemoprotein reductase n=1 Tax=Linderina pennispora TaxID=61395 RepID=A0A1Y1WCD4_9FUNG|nr:riboflavin synthase domain-like protein [Linderina pennispora]ORX70988.1 riboflavin synthase domain-like protein [Linderina pennispora]